MRTGGQTKTIVSFLVKNALKIMSVIMVVQDISH